jgi:hypothetical protein
MKTLASLFVALHAFLFAHCGHSKMAISKSAKIAKSQITKSQTS